MPHPEYYTISVTVPAAVFTSLIRQSLSIIIIVVCIYVNHDKSTKPKIYYAFFHWTTPMMISELP